MMDKSTFKGCFYCVRFVRLWHKKKRSFRCAPPTQSIWLTTPKKTNFYCPALRKMLLLLQFLLRTDHNQHRTFF